MKSPIIGAAVLLSACVASHTTIQSSWTDGEYVGPPLGRVAVAATFESRADSLPFERNAAEYFAARGVATVPARELLASADAEALGETEIRERLAATGVDGVLTFRLIAVEERREHQVPAPHLPDGPPQCASPGASSSLHRPSTASTASLTGSFVYSSGCWIEQTFLVAETALFDNRNDRLLWTAKSETMDAARFELTSESIVRSVARRLFAANLIAVTADDPESGARRGERG